MLIGVIAEETLLPLVIRSDTFIDGTWPDNPFYHVVDTIWQPTSTIIGFTMPGLFDETDGGGWTPAIGAPPGTFAPDGVQIPYGPRAAEVFGHTYITQDYRGIWPDLYDDTMPEVFYEFTHGFIPVLRPDWFPEGDSFFPADLNDTTLAIRPLIVFKDSEIFYAPVFRSDLAPDLFVDDDIIRAQVIRRAGDPIVLLSEPFTDADIFFTPIGATGLRPSAIVDADIFYGASQVATLFPSAFAADDVFFVSHVVSQLRPIIISDVDVFIGPELRTPGRMELFVDFDIMPAVGVGVSSSLRPVRVTDAEFFFVPFVGDRPPLYPFDSIVDVDDTFYVPTFLVDNRLSPFRWVEPDLFNTPSVIHSQVVGPPSLFIDTDAFYAPTVSRGAGSPAFTDADLFYVPLLKYDQAAAPDIWGDADVIPAATILSGIKLQPCISASRGGIASVIVSTNSAVTTVQIISNLGAVG